MTRNHGNETDENASIYRLIRNVVIGVVVLFLLLLGSCGVDRIKPDAGQEAVLIEKPILFGHGGVDPVPVGTGSEYVAWTTQAVYVNMQPQQFTFSTSDMMSSNGIPLHFDAAIRLQVIDSVKLVRQFGPQWYNNNVSSEFANRVRQATRKHSMNELAIDTTGIDAVDREVSIGMEQYLKATGLPVRLVRVTVGKATPPQEIKDQRILTAAQDQRVATELSTKRAEDNRREAERSRAIADNAYRETLDLTPQEFVDLQRISMQKEVCTKNACTFIVGNGSPVINTGK